MPSWGGTRSELVRLRRQNDELAERLAVAEQVLEATQQDAHFRLAAIEAEAA